MEDTFLGYPLVVAQTLLALALWNHPRIGLNIRELDLRYSQMLSEFFAAASELSCVSSGIKTRIFPSQSQSGASKEALRPKATGGH